MEYREYKFESANKGIITAWIEDGDVFIDYMGNRDEEIWIENATDPDEVIARMVVNGIRFNNETHAYVVCYVIDEYLINDSMSAHDAVLEVCQMVDERPSRVTDWVAGFDRLPLTATSRRDAARARWTPELDGGLPTGVYHFENGTDWAIGLGDIYELNLTIDGTTCRTTFRTDNHLNTEDADVFTDMCDFLDRLATGWRPVNWTA